MIPLTKAFFLVLETDISAADAETTNKSLNIYAIRTKKKRKTMKYSGGQFAQYVLLSFIFISVPGHALDVGISVSIDKNKVSTGEIPMIGIAGFNREAIPLVLDVHVGAIAPDGTIYEFPDWNTALQPWLPGNKVPANFQLPETFLTALEIPGGLTPGTWKAAAALTHPGTLDLVSFHSIPFEVIAPTGGTKIVNGQVSVTHNRTASETTVSASASFSSFLVLGEIDSNPPGVDQCRFDKMSDISADIDPASIEYLDAGEFIDMAVDSGGRVALSNKSNPTIYQPPGIFLPTAAYQAGQGYTASATGGSQISAFNVSAIAPDILSVSQPDINNFNVIDAQHNLELRWTPSTIGIGEIKVEISGQGAIISCLFLDDGVASVSADQLIQLRDFLSASSAINDVSFGILRINIVRFNTVNNDISVIADGFDNGLFSIASRVAAQPKIQ